MPENDISRFKNESRIEEGEDFVDLTEEEFDLIIHKATRKLGEDEDTDEDED